MINWDEFLCIFIHTFVAPHIASEHATSSGDMDTANGQLPLMPEDCANVTEATHCFRQVFDSRYVVYIVFVIIIICFSRCSYGSTHGVFFEGDLKSAVAEAQHSQLMLVVYLHNDKSIAANIFASTVCDLFYCFILIIYFIYR
jgi:hypothetical protein